MAAKRQLIVPAATWAIRSIFQSLVALLIALLFFAAVYVTQNNVQLVEDRLITSKRSRDLLLSSPPRCNLFSGKWVFDNKSYPLYREKDCTFMSDQLACEKFGRKDLNYQFWRWQPHHCDLPRSVQPQIYILEHTDVRSRDTICIWRGCLYYEMYSYSCFVLT